MVNRSRQPSLVALVMPALTADTIRLMRKLLQLALFAVMLKAGYSLIQKLRSLESLPEGAPFTPASVPSRVTLPDAVEESSPAHGGFDDLTAVQGIGPVYASKLHALDITDLNTLATADIATLAASLSVSETTIAAWQSQASELGT